jgi:uncharacterized repeat protein (TIGR01451 family)
VDVEVAIAENQDPVAPGEQLVYTIRVSNLGPDTAENVRASIGGDDPTEAAINFISLTQTSGPTFNLTIGPPHQATR